MAGGNSVRFQSNKLLYVLEGRPMFEHGLDAWIEVKETRKYDLDLILVTQYEEIHNIAVRKYGDRISCIVDPSCTQGASCTIKAGLQAAKEADYAIFMSADQPWISAKTIGKLLDQTEKQHPLISGAGILPVELVNPVCFSRFLFDELEMLEKDQGGKKVARKTDPAQWLIIEPEDPRELKDIDSLSDLKQEL